MFGVAIFSYIMGNFIEILMGYKQLDIQGDHRELSKWIALLSKFNGSQPLSRNVVLRIEEFFDYYWQNNPLMAFKSENDMRFLQELPEITVQEIYIDYLFRDFIFQFKHIFLIEFRGRVLEQDDQRFRRFMVQFLNCLEPRFYKADEGLIQDQFQEVDEVTYVINGGIFVGYRLFNEIFYAKVISRNAIIGDFSCLHNKVSEFLYMA